MPWGSSQSHRAPLPHHRKSPFFSELRCHVFPVFDLVLWHTPHPLLYVQDPAEAVFDHPTGGHHRNGVEHW
jgi:hypothetical protein